MSGENETTTEERGSHQPTVGRHGEPWRLLGNQAIVTDRGKRPVVLAAGYREQAGKLVTRRDDGRLHEITDDEPLVLRAIACVNACEGIDPVAVPDVLDALRNIVASVRSGEFTLMCHDIDGTHPANLDAARAAIAKAKLVTS